MIKFIGQKGLNKIGQKYKELKSLLNTKADKSEIKTKSRSATFVIANYDSSENSKAGADYVIQESDCAAEIINGFIEKLPSYGGKIQLTEGNLNIKKDLSINFNKNNVIIEGYGNATNIIDKLTKDERNSVIINIAVGITNCRLLDLNIIHESSNSIIISGNKNYIKNVNIINNGTHVSFAINDNTSENVLENCSVKCDSGYCYWIKDTSENNKISNCSGTSTKNTIFSISGSNNQLTNCFGVISITAKNTLYSDSIFSIENSNNRLLNCMGIAPISYIFKIESSNNQLANCSGITNSGILCDIKSENNQILNFNGTVKGVAAYPTINVYGTNNSVIGCNLIGTEQYFRVNGSKHLIVNNFLTREITNESTNSIISNNIVK